jgi:hypothetical protein
MAHRWRTLSLRKGMLKPSKRWGGPLLLRAVEILRGARCPFVSMCSFRKWNFGFQMTELGASG